MFLKTKTLMFNAMKQYQIVVVNLAPTLGSEITKTRPCLIVSPDEMNKHLNTVVIVPITSNSKPYPSRIFIDNNKYKGWAAMDQIRTIAKERIVSFDGFVSEQEITQIKRAIREMLVD